MEEGYSGDSYMVEAWRVGALPATGTGFKNPENLQVVLHAFHLFARFLEVVCFMRKAVKIIQNHSE